MPELPDVEGYRRYFARHARGKSVAGVSAPAPDMLRNTSPAAMARSLRGRRFASPDRHGKWLIAPTGGPMLVFHFGMTGRFNWAREGPLHRHDRVVLRFADGTLRYRNMRKLGGVWLARSAGEVDGITGQLGPDALDLDREAFVRLLAARRGGLKATLMNQRVIAGIGNELSDEVLWQARLHPSRGVASLDDRGIRRLHRIVRRVIVASNRHGRIPRKRTWISSQRGVGSPSCPRCGAELRRSRIVGRTSYWCSRCQPE
jgi:formamidopyrimidine-DNA glycosylase